ncbi:hypothetical protein [Frankia sp. Cr2]|uniref:hypothetical protein n=1 Tax=Frankia sp. Cr2 TaxID=3073932 RepID=UPI002AD46702|nr:hypothetical protein [Frankia sp. Cr2]
MAPNRSFRTVDDAAAIAAAMISNKYPLLSVWRHAVLQLLDDYTSVLRHSGTEAAAAIWAAPPRPSGDQRVDGALAALAEHLARRDAWRPPGWVHDPRREAEPWWFVTALRGMQPRALVESPLSFRKRGVFITDGALDRA